MDKEDKDLSQGQFQKKLNKWFEENGLLKDLRSHLRHLMVNVLHDTNVGLRPNYEVSPKLQAINLLIAEFLLSQRYHYTLSVLTSEVPSLSTLPPFSNSKSVQPETSDNRRKQFTGFLEHDLEDILHALGLPPNCQLNNNISALYLDQDNNDCLLVCLLKSVQEHCTSQQIQQDFRTNPSRSDINLSSDWSTKLIQLLLKYQVKQTNVVMLHDRITRLSENEVSRIVNEERVKEEERLIEREMKIQEDIKEHEELVKKRLSEAEIELRTAREEINDDILVKQERLTELAADLRRQHDDMMKRLRYIKEQEENLAKEQNKLEKEENLKKNSKQEKDPDDEKIKNNRQHVEELNRQLEELRVRERSLEDENQNLRAAILTRNKCIVDLRSSNSTLGNRVEELRQLNNVLSARLTDTQAPPPPPPAVPVVYTPTRIRIAPRQVGAGEAATTPLGISVSTRPDTYVPRGSSRRSSPHKTEASTSTSHHLQLSLLANSAVEKNDFGTETDPETEAQPKQIKKLKQNSEEDEEDGVLTQVKHRYKRLEQESEEVDKRVCELKNTFQSLPGTSQRGAVNVFVFDNNEQPTTRPDGISNRPQYTFPTRHEGLHQNLNFPNRRQIYNHNFYLKSRQYLRRMERGNDDDSTSSSSSSSSSSDDFIRTSKKFVTKKNSERVASGESRNVIVVDTPLKTASFYTQQDQTQPDQVQNNDNQKPEEISELPQVDISLRQQLLAVTTSGSESESKKESVVSVGEKNKSDDDFWK